MSRTARVAAVALAASGLTALPVALAAPAQAAACAPVSIVSARGTTEPQSGSMLNKPTGDKIAKKASVKTKYTELEYPATADFVGSPNTGVDKLVRLLNAEAQSCPDQKYVLLGYSQGAMVVGDTLVAPSQRLNGRSAPALSAAAAEKVSAVVFFGNPRFTAGEPYNAGTHQAGKGGIMPRPKGQLSAYASRIKDFCNQGDMVCQGGFNAIAHIMYIFDGTGEKAATFAAQQLAG